MPGIVRGLDSRGRLTIPMDMLRAAGLGPGDLFEVWCHTDTEGKPILTLEPVPMSTMTKCALCGGPLDKGRREVANKPVCKTCIACLTKV